MDRFIGEGNQLPGAQALVWRRGELVDFQSAGYRDRENRLPVEEDTIFRIYSMTKPIVSVAAMMLFEEGHFQLNLAVTLASLAAATLGVERKPARGIAAGAGLGDLGIELADFVEDLDVGARR